MKVFSVLVAILMTWSFAMAEEGFEKDRIVGEKVENGGRRSIVEIITTGYGSDIRSAEEDALNEALKKVNGTKLNIGTSSTSLESSVTEKNKGSASVNVKQDSKSDDTEAVAVSGSGSDGVSSFAVGTSKSNKNENNVTVDSSSETTQSVTANNRRRDVSQSSGGFIKTYETVASVKNDDGSYKVQLRVFIFKTIQKAPDKRIRAVFRPFKLKDSSYSDFASGFGSNLAAVIAKSSKIAVMEKEYTGSNLKANYIITGSIDLYAVEITERKLVTVNKSIYGNVQKAVISLRVIESGSGITKFADTVVCSVTGKGDKPDISELEAEVAKIAGAKVLDALFPSRVKTVSKNTSPEPKIQKTEKLEKIERKEIINEKDW